MLVEDKITIDYNLRQIRERAVRYGKTPGGIARTGSEDRGSVRWAIGACLDGVSEGI